MRNKANDHALGVALLGLSTALLPVRPRTAVWLLTRKPARAELRRLARAFQRLSWSDRAGLMGGVAGGVALVLEIELRRRPHRGLVGAGAPTR
jgi:hypothetical protein